jgi:hypothetical protein
LKSKKNENYFNCSTFSAIALPAPGRGNDTGVPLKNTPECKKLFNDSKKCKNVTGCSKLPGTQAFLSALEEAALNLAKCVNTQINLSEKCYGDGHGGHGDKVRLLQQGEDNCQKKIKEARKQQDADAPPLQEMVCLFQLLVQLRFPLWHFKG